MRHREVLSHQQLFLPFQLTYPKIKPGEGGGGGVGKKAFVDESMMISVDSMASALHFISMLYFPL